MAVAAAETTSLVAFTLPGTPYSVQMARFYVRAALTYHDLAHYVGDVETVTSDSLNLSICSCGPFCWFSGCGSRGFRGRFCCFLGG
jgi:hypothetical protein